MGKNIAIKATDGSGEFSAYLAEPTAGKGPAVVVLQEIFGVNTNIRAVCDRLSGEGFFALAPDMFWRQEPGVDLTYEQFDKARTLLSNFNRTHGIADIKAAIKAAKSLPGCTGKVGAVGYCMGGFLAYIAAATTDIDAAVGYYGVRIATVLDMAPQITKPLMLHIAGKDAFVPPAEQASMHTALDNHPHVTLYDYENADHAFARPDGMHYEASAAALADSRTLSFLQNHLKG